MVSQFETLSDDEISLVKVWRQTDSEHRKAILDLLDEPKNRE